MIKLIRDWYLGTDSRQFVVGKARPQKKNRRTSLQLEDPRYYRAVITALKRVQEIEMQAAADGAGSDPSESVTITAAIHEMEMGCKHFHDTLEKLDKAQERDR